MARSSSLFPRRVVLVSLVMALAGSLPVATPLLAEPAVPAALAPWVPWVLESHPDLICPWLGEARLCLWPGFLRLELDDRGGSFELQVYADRDVDLRLPGDAAIFPREVSLDGRPALLRRAGEGPALALPRGEHRVAGSFRWPRLPESLPLPREIALVDLRLRGARVVHPHREANGLLWLAARTTEANEEDRLSIEVFRRIEDGVPALLETRLMLRVSGAAREIDLGEVLPALFEPYQLESDLPARYGRDRRLRVQLRPGEWWLRLGARSRGPLLELSAATRPSPWPQEEIWVFAANPAVRATRVEGAAGIDPQRTSLPDEWKSLPAFQLRGSDTLRFEELRRGEPQPTPDEVSVGRTIWLAEAGDRFISRDRLTGTLNQGGRLEALAPAVLGRAALGAPEGQRANQVITLSPEGGTAGVEVRSGKLDLEADAVYPRDSELPAVGWNRDASQLRIELRVGPGWSLLATRGVDVTRGAWVDTWSLLDFFLLLIVVLAILKLEGRLAACVALVALALSWQERYALVLVWLLLALLALRGLALLRAEGSPRRLLRLGVTIALLATLILFVSWQWRTGRHPQLDRTSQAFELPSFGGGEYAALASPEEQQEGQRVLMPESSRRYEPVRKQIAMTYSQSERSRQVDPNAVVQTGPGVPLWSRRSFYLSWQGPVKADQTLRLYLISPAQEFFLSVLRIVGWLALAGLLFGGLGRFLPPRQEVEDPDSRGPSGAGGHGDPPLRQTGGHGDPPLRQEGSSGPGGHLVSGTGGHGDPPLRPVATLVLFALLLGGSATRAQEAPQSPDSPPADLLQELERRLTQPPDCAPSCVELSRLDLHAEPAGLRFEGVLHAAADSAWLLPGPSAVFVPSEVLLDGRPAAAIRLQEDGFFALRLARGVHRVEVRGAARDSLSLQFPLTPRVLTFEGRGFTIDGLREGEPPPGLVRIDRVLPSGEDGPAAAVELSPWLELVRQLDIGLPWMVHYELRRLSPGGAAVLLRVPLLPGEAVTSAGVPVEAGEALISLEPGETERQWSTTLSERAELVLEAPAARPWLERWELDCSPIWHCTAQGLAPISHMQDGKWRPEWRPWPGEQLALSFVRPEGAPGQTTTLDKVELSFEPGRRLLEGRLDIMVRASRGGEQNILLPADAELLAFTIDKAAVPVQNLGGKVTYTLEPGERQVELRWRQDHEASLFERMPAVDIGSEAANVLVNVSLPDHRWMLLTGGRGWGPVVLFWQDLLAILLAAWVLGRFAPTPLSSLDWALLGVGLTQVPFAAAVAVVVWLVLLGSVPRPPRAWRHDFLQIILLGLGLVALGTLYAAVHSGLLMQPDMQVAGVGNGPELQWLAQRVEGKLPQPWVLWVPMGVYRGLMLLWALWLASRLIRWLPWCWQQLYREGKLFRLPEAWRAYRRRGKTPSESPAGPPPSS